MSRSMLISNARWYQKKNLMKNLENWGTYLANKSVFQKKKVCWLGSFKNKNRIMPVEFLLKYPCMVFFLKNLGKQLPIFSINNELQTSKCNQNARTVKNFPTLKSDSEFFNKSLMLQAMKLYNEVP